MGLLDKILGNAAEVDTETLEKEIGPLLVEGEEVESAFKVMRDMFIFTNRRLILIDKQGITGSKAEYHSIPYRSIYHFAAETAGSFDRDSELKIWVAGSSEPIKRRFTKKTNIGGVQRAIASHVL